MRIAKLSVRNYRTLEFIDLEFPSFYTALCGKNDAGKTNVVRAIRFLMKEDEPYFYGYGQEMSIGKDFTKWVEVDPKERRISISAQVVVHRRRDTGLFEFIVDYLSLKKTEEDLVLDLDYKVNSEEPAYVITLRIGEQVFEGLKAEQVLRKLQSGSTVLFHNSTEPNVRYGYGSGFFGFMKDIPEEYRIKLDKQNKDMAKLLNKIAKEQQKEIGQLIGRLEQKYDVALSLPALDLSHLPYNLALRDRKVDVQLDAWGSGTQNRTLILLTLFRARQVSEASTTASKITPIIVIEEPESFLHPSAQAEFGRVLQDLAEEFNVQLIVTTHSPYMLSQVRPESNVLLERETLRSQSRKTVRRDTSGKNWMEPFGLALGLNVSEFEPWKNLFFAKADSILLVEGEIDKEYFELLRDQRHGQNKLRFDGEIFPYSGADTLKNSVLLRFVKERYKKIFITYDLDAENRVEKALKSIGFERKINYHPVGMPGAGKAKIEGLLPEEVKKNVYMENPELVEALSGTPEERRSAEGRLKRLLLEKFKDAAESNVEHFKNFYPLVRIINNAFG